MENRIDAGSSDILNLVVILVFGVVILFHFIIFPISFTYRMLVVLYVKIWKTDFGDILSYAGQLIFDDFHTDPANCTLLTVLTIEGSLGLQEIRDLFTKNVLQAKLAKGTLRYPELKQHLVAFMGHVFWRNETTFKIEDHISERVYTPGRWPTMGGVYEEMLNKTYPRDKSPWEVFLIRNYPSGEKGKRKSILVFRFHHCMADAKSIVKLVVEGLCQKELKTAKASEIKRPWWHHLTYYILLPYHLYKLSVSLYNLEQQTEKHPWRVREPLQDESSSRFLVGISPKLSLEEVKHTATKLGIRAPAVLMAIVTAAVSKFDRGVATLPGVGLPIGLSLPRPRHPDYLTNHAYVGITTFPTDEERPFHRLQKCNESYNRVRFGDLRSLDIMGFFMATLALPIRKCLGMPSIVSAGFTNIAGEEDPVFVGGWECSEFGFCTGIPKGSTGVFFSILSYKDNLQITVVANSSIMDGKKVEKLAELVGEEAGRILEKPQSMTPPTLSI